MSLNNILTGNIDSIAPYISKSAQLIACCVLSMIGFFFLRQLIPKFSKTFMDAGFSGKDMSKKDQVKIPEAQGVLCGAVYLIILFLFIPIPFWNYLLHPKPFPHEMLIEFLAGLLSICCMIFLGFADDALNLRWRHKLVLPTVATLPLLMVYFINFGSTTIIVPKPFRFVLGFDVNIGILYYIYMGMLAVFCTNAINIYAGINGIEAGQSLIIAGSVILFNIIEYISGRASDTHLFSLFFMVPYFSVCLALLTFNWYPSRVFVGDTFCYFSGMTFAVVGILSHFGKTLLLFFIPQILNFLYSTPQLFHLIPCPRHRLPRYNPNTDQLGISTTKFHTNSLGFLGRLSFNVLRTFRLISVEDLPDNMVECNNLTIINFFIRMFGSIHERKLTIILLMLQVLCSGVAFFIRYPLAWLFFDN